MQSSIMSEINGEVLITDTLDRYLYNELRGIITGVAAVIDSFVQDWLFVCVHR